MSFPWCFCYPHPTCFRTSTTSTVYPFPGVLDELWTPNSMGLSTDDFRSSWYYFYVPTDLAVEPTNTLLARSRDWLLKHRDESCTALSVSSVSLLPAPQRGCINFLVVTDELLEGLEDVTDLDVQALKQRTKGIKSLRATLSTPSSGVETFSGVMNVIEQSKGKFHTGRPAANFGPPVSLFNHVLGRFDYDLCHLDELDPLPSLINDTHSFMSYSAESYRDEETRIAVIKYILNSIIGIPLNWNVEPARFGIKPDAITFSDTPFFVVEVKNEVGLEGDASLQAALSYAHIATSPLGQSSICPAVHSNYPAVLYGIMGNLLEIGVATYTDGPYYNLLFSERLHLDFYAAQNVLRLARAFQATRRVLTELKEFYNNPLPPQGNFAHLFPSPLPIPTYNDPVPLLTFKRRLSRDGETFVLANLAKDETARQSGIYLATMPRLCPDDEDTLMSLSADTPAELDVVVKFTAQYEPEAHRLLADAGLAPALHACVPVCGSLFMVVMDIVQGEPAWKAKELLPYTVYEDIDNAIKLLHSKDLVFGDLRMPNIMVVPVGSGPDIQYRGMLLDFDWVGRHGAGRYPASLNERLDEWQSSGIRRHGIMDKKHDLAMLNKFKSRCRPL